MTDTNHHVLTGKVDITSNLLVGSSHLFVDTNNNRVGLVTTNPAAGLHVNSNAYVNTDLRVGSQIEINATAGRVKAGSFEGDGSLLENIPAGADGSAATIAVGTTTTGAAGTSASVTNSGTNSTAVFDFTIPKGDAGTNGNDGDDGAAATIGTPTITTGLAGTDASVTNSGTTSAAVFDFVIPRGDAGTNGNDGTNYFELSGSNIYRTTGNVGIGTNNPNVKLHVGGGDVGIDRDQKFDFGAGYSANWYIKQKSADNKIYFERTGGSGNELVIDTTGNVGIGTSTFVDSRALLHIKTSGGIAFQASTNSNSRNWRIRNDDMADWGSLQFSVSDNNSSHPSSSSHAVMTMLRNKNVGIGYGAPSQRFAVNGDAWINTELYVMGNVGIGRTSPGAKLDVNGTVLATSFEYTTSDGVTKFRSGNTGSLAQINGKSIGEGNPGGKFSIWESSVGSESSYIGIGGDYIAMCSPTDSSISIIYYDEDQGPGGSRVWHITNTGTLVGTSDSRKKRDIKPLMWENILEKIGNLEPSTFKFKRPESCTRKTQKWDIEHIGFIAQNVQENFPELVTEDESSSDKYLMVNLTMMILPVIQGMQQLTNELQTTKEELQTTKEELQSEKNKVATMELLVASLVKRVGDLENLVI